MTPFTFSTGERYRIRSWLEKRPNAETLTKQYRFKRDDGSTLLLTRCTQYIPGGEWKIRIAYTQNNGYPIMTSGPLQHGLNEKVGKQDKSGMVPKNYAWEEDAKAAFYEQMNKPISTIWDAIAAAAEPSDHDGHVTFHIQTKKAHAKTVDLDELLEDYDQ